MILKYGMNPNQEYAEFEDNDNLQVLNGNPSYINFLDALNSWQLARELREATEAPAATSFKHVTPSGAAIAKPFERNELQSYNRKSAARSGLTAAYLKARGSDRLASFGDFIALSDKVDVETAKQIRSEVSDGIIAPGFESDALEILKGKKKGSYPVFQINADYEPETIETRQVFGFSLKQSRNDLRIDPGVLQNIRTEGTPLPEPVVENLLVGLITLKFTQSNSITIARNSHVIGIGSGQQSRILCADLALTKANRWYQKTKLDYVSIDYPAERMSKTERDILHDQVRKEAYGDGVLLDEAEDICLCSDGFFPQTDNIHLAHRYGVRYIAAPMGSIMDEEILRVCTDLGITFIDIGIRLFHH